MIIPDDLITLSSTILELQSEAADRAAASHAYHAQGTGATGQRAGGRTGGLIPQTPPHTAHFP